MTIQAIQIEHPYQPLSYGDRVFCGWVEVRDGCGRVCERPEVEHPPASAGSLGGDAEAGV